MDEKFLLGIALGMLGGSLVVANSVKARQMVKSGQQQAMKKVSGLTNQSKQKSKKEN